MDKLALLRGDPFRITPHVTVNNPTIGEICNASEEKYFQLITRFVATAYDYRLFLNDQGIDYVEIEDFQLFMMFYSGFEYEDTKLLLPGINFQELIPAINQESGEIALVDEEGNVIFDKLIHHEMVDFLRTCHGFKRNWKVPGNAAAREFLMQEEREASKANKCKPFESILEPLVSALCNSGGFKYNYNTIWDLPIYAFFDSVHRIQKIFNASNLAIGICAGNADTSKMNKTQLNNDLNWMGPL